MTITVTQMDDCARGVTINEMDADGIGTIVARVYGAQQPYGGMSLRPIPEALLRLISVAGRLGWDRSIEILRAEIAKDQ